MRRETRGEMGEEEDRRRRKMMEEAKERNQGIWGGEILSTTCLSYN